jgi:putative endonuclease
MRQTMFKRNEGIHGETLAVSYLQKQGFIIIDRNFRIRGGEIDIIAIDRDTLSFVEVKTRMSNAFGTPLEAISYWKLKSLIKTAQYYKSMHPRLPALMRIDAVSIVLAADKSISSIDLVKNIS